MRLSFPWYGFRAFVLLVVFSLGEGCFSHRPIQPFSNPARPFVLGDLPTGPVPTQIISATVVPVPAMPFVSSGQTVPLVPQEPATPAPSEMARKVQAVVDRNIRAVFEMNRATLFGLALLVAMLGFYAVADRSPFFILAFAIACGIGSAYGFGHWPWPFGLVGGVWGIVALRKWWQQIHSENRGPGKTRHPALLWPTRYLYMAAVISGVILLIVDSPVSAYLPIPVTRAVVEAVPLLLVGIAFLAWLAIDRPPIFDLIKQVFIALAFILWGVDLLMPAGPWARAVGAVVIAIYVFDLAWLMEDNLRKKFAVNTSTGANGTPVEECKSAGVCSFARGAGLPGTIPITQAADRGPSDR